MESKGKTGPKLCPGGELEQAARRAREAEALRANLLKRKAQARGRQDSAPGQTSGRAPGHTPDETPRGS